MEKSHWINKTKRNEINSWMFPVLCLMIANIHAVLVTSEMEMGHCQGLQAHRAAMWLSETFSSCQSLSRTISVSVSLLPAPAATHMAHWSGINMVPLSLDPKCLSARMCFLTELSHNPSLSLSTVNKCVCSYRVLILCERYLDSIIPTETVRNAQ